MHFCFILLLALRTIEDLHIKLRCAAVVIEKHKEALMQVMILYKLGPAPLKYISPWSS
jgi:hypothetical protein